MFCPAQRRTCRGRLVICPGPCNRRNRRPSVSPEKKVEDTSDLEGSVPGRQICVTPIVPSVPGSRDTLNCQDRPELSMCPAKCSPRNQGETPAEKCYGFKDEVKELRQGLALREPTTIENTLKRMTRKAPAIISTFLVSVVHFPLILLSLIGTNGIPLTDRSPWSKCLMAGGIFIGGHVLMGYAAWNNPTCQTFLAAEFFGLLTLLFWRVSGSVPL